MYHLYLPPKLTSMCWELTHSGETCPKGDKLHTYLLHIIRRFVGVEVGGYIINLWF